MKLAHEEVTQQLSRVVERSSSHLGSGCACQRERKSWLWCRAPSWNTSQQDNGVLFLSPYESTFIHHLSRSNNVLDFAFVSWKANAWPELKSESVLFTSLYERDLNQDVAPGVMHRVTNPPPKTASASRRLSLTFVPGTIPEGGSL